MEAQEGDLWLPMDRSMLITEVADARTAASNSELCTVLRLLHNQTLRAEAFVLLLLSYYPKPRHKQQLRVLLSKSMPEISNACLQSMPELANALV